MLRRGMGKLYGSLEDVRSFIERQHLFFVATAPTDVAGHVNLSPKGLDGFRVLGPKSAAYVDYPGSGVETIAHLRDNGRIVLMFCSFTGAPNVVRVWGRGRVLEPGDDGFDELLAHFSPKLVVRALIAIDVERVGSACGFGVPLYDYRGEREELLRWADRKGEAGLAAYMNEKNAASIDGLPGLARSRS